MFLNNYCTDFMFQEAMMCEHVHLQYGLSLFSISF